MMKHLITIFLLATAAISVTAQSDCTLQYDGNGDGIVNSTDVLGLLTEFGASCIDTTTIDTVGFQNCGDPIFYQGYNYATVLIGEQCWFAENLRSENYRDGTAIPSNLGIPQWQSTTFGATSVYGEIGACSDVNAPGACDQVYALDLYGRLYNWYAVDDSRGLCPSGWHIPTDGDWITLEITLGMSEGEAYNTNLRGTDQGTQLKTTFGWWNDGNGTDSHGFSGLPGGQRADNGYQESAGHYGIWWTSTMLGSLPYARVLTSAFDGVFRGGQYPASGFSVRCLKDPE